MVDKMSPEVRFPFCKGDWKKSMLGELIKLFGGNAFSSLDSSSSGIPWVKIANVGIDGINWNESSYLPPEFWNTHIDYRLFKGDCVMALTRPILNHNLKISIIDKEALLNQRVAKITFQTDPNFGYQILKIRSVVRRIENELAGSDPPNLSNKNLNNIEVSIPNNIKEQQKIGEFFKNLDDRIALQQQHIERLKETKQGFLQKMFPKDGERVPEVRFRGFTGDWGRSKLGEFVEDYIEKTTVQNQHPVLTSSQKHGIILQEEYYSNRQVTTQNNIGYFVLPRGYFTFRSRSDNGVFSFNRNNLIDKGIISYFYPVFKISNGDSDFFLKLLNSTLKKQVSIESEGTGQRVLSLKKFKNINVIVPSIQEQQKIGEFFKKLDDTIAIQEKELELLQETKKGFLQKMFV